MKSNLKKTLDAISDILDNEDISWESRVKIYDVVADLAAEQYLQGLKDAKEQQCIMKAGGNMNSEEAKKLQAEHEKAMEGIRAFNEAMRGFIDAANKRKYM